MRGAGGGGLAVLLPPRAASCKLPSSFHLMQPRYPLLQALRHWAHLGRFASCSCWGPPKRGLRGLAAPPSLIGGGWLAAGGADDSSGGHRLWWAESREAILAQSDVHPSELRCHLGESLRVPHLESSPLDVGVWAGSGDLTPRGAFRVWRGR